MLFVLEIFNFTSAKLGVWACISRSSSFLGVGFHGERKAALCGIDQNPLRCPGFFSYEPVPSLFGRT